MKIALNRFGLFNYTISGADAETETAAAAELEEKLEQIDRLAALGWYPGSISEDISDARRAVAEKYSVHIGTTV